MAAASLPSISMAASEILTLFLALFGFPFPSRFFLWQCNLSSASSYPIPLPVSTLIPRFVSLSIPSYSPFSNPLLTLYRHVFVGVSACVCTSGSLSVFLYSALSWLWSCSMNPKSTSAPNQLTIRERDRHTHTHTGGKLQIE